MAVKAKPAPANSSGPAFSGGIKRLKIGELTGAAYNPPARVKVGSARMRQLIRSIEEEGLIYPIAVGDDGTIIDGHRRLTACRHLGWDEVPVLVLMNKDRSKLYADINSTPEMMSGLQVLQVWLKEPTAVSVRAQRSLERYEETFGRAAIKKVAKANMSYNILNTALRISRYCEDESPGFLRTTLDWLLSHRYNRTVKEYMTLRLVPEKLWSIINKDQTLEMTFSTKK